MARVLRLWQKKRGDRRTGSNFVGRVGQAVAYVALLGTGGMTLAATVTSQWSLNATDQFFLTGWILWLVILLGLSFVGIGGVGIAGLLYAVGASAERRSAIETRAANIDLLSEGDEAEKFPCIVDEFDESPGVRLAYRLPIAQLDLWKLTFATIATVAWNTMLAALIVITAKQFLIGRTNSLLIVFTLIAISVGVWSIYYFLRQLLLHVGIGPTTIEISKRHVQPGGEYEVYVSQEGKLNFRDLELFLLCLEEATYQQGTDIRTEVTPVFRKRIFRKRKLQIDAGEPFQWEGSFQIPAEAMHSFKSQQNAVHWRLLVRGKATGWPTFERNFPLVVYPPERSSEPQTVQDSTTRAEL